MDCERRLLGRVGLAAMLLWATAPLAFAQRISPARNEQRAMREMHIYQVKELGLEVWIEGQPEWDVQLQQHNSRPLLVAQSPNRYHPPAALTFGVWDKGLIGNDEWEGVARAAILQGGRNFGLSEGMVRTLPIEAASYGPLNGWQGQFVGLAGTDRVDVRVFVGRAPNKPIVVLTAYTLAGKFEHLHEVIRRSWGSVLYLK